MKLDSVFKYQREDKGTPLIKNLLGASNSPRSELDTNLLSQSERKKRRNFFSNLIRPGFLGLYSNALSESLHV